MGLAMIKPFQVIESRPVANGNIGVTYQVWKFECIGPGRTRQTKMEAYTEVAPGQDIDQHLFQTLSEAGWF